MNLQKIRIYLNYTIAVVTGGISIIAAFRGEYWESFWAAAVSYYAFSLGKELSFYA
jgi:hypothetical protein